MQCKNCGLEWENRVKQPRECPSCKIRLDRIKLKENRGERDGAGRSKDLLEKEN